MRHGLCLSIRDVLFQIETSQLCTEVFVYNSTGCTPVFCKNMNFMSLTFSGLFDRSLNVTQVVNL